MVSTRSVLALCLLVCLAGCGGFFGGDGGDGGVTTTAPPDGTPTSTATPTPTPESVTAAYPAGVTEDGRLVNVTALVAGHDRALADETYSAALTLHQSQREGDNVSNRTTDQTVTVGDGVYRTDLTTERTASPVFNATAWSNGTVAVRQATIGGEPQYQVLPPDRFIAQLSGQRTLSGYIELGNYSVSRVTSTDGLRRVTLTADQYAGTAEDTTIESFESTLVVDEEGRIREYDVRVVTVKNGTRVVVDFHYELTTLSDVSVEKPDWVPQALNASS